MWKLWPRLVQIQTLDRLCWIKLGCLAGVQQAIFYKNALLCICIFSWQITDRYIVSIWANHAVLRHLLWKDNSQKQETLIIESGKTVWSGNHSHFVLQNTGLVKYLLPKHMQKLENVMLQYVVQDCIQQLLWHSLHIILPVLVCHSEYKCLLTV